MIILQSLKCFTLFFFIELLVEQLKTFQLEMGEGFRLVRVYVQWRVIASIHVHTIRVGVNFLPLWSICTN